MKIMNMLYRLNPFLNQVFPYDLRTERNNKNKPRLNPFLNQVFPYMPARAILQGNTGLNPFLNQVFPYRSLKTKNGDDAKSQSLLKSGLSVRGDSLIKFTKSCHYVSIPS